MNRLYAEIAAAAILLALGLWYRSHLIGIGEERIKAKDAELMAAQTIRNAEVESRAKALANKQFQDYQATVSKPPDADAPHLRVCGSPSVRPVPQAARPSAGADATQPIPAVVSPVPQGSWDFGPDIDKRFRDDDALIAALQAQIELEKGICR